MFKKTISFSLMQKFFFKILLYTIVLSLCTSYLIGGIAKADSESRSQLQLSESPQRIVVFPLFAEEMLFEMIDPNRIVGVGHEYWEHGEAYSPTMEFTKHTRNDLSIRDVEEILDLNPDLVVLWKAEFDDYKTLLPELKKYDISVLFLDTPANFMEVMNSLSMLGEAVGASQKAEQMIQDLKTGLAQLEGIIEGVSENKRIRVTDYHDYYPIDVYDVIASAAGVFSDGGSVFIDRHYDYLEIDDGLLSEWNPDLITIRPFSMDTDGTILDISEEYVNMYITHLLNKPGLSTVSAIQNHNIHPLSIYNSQYMLQSAEDLARLAYPELFAK